MALDWSNQQEVLKRRQQAIDAGYKSSDVDTFIEKKRTEQASLNLLQSGQAELTGEQALKDPLLAEKAVKSGVKITKKLSEYEQKRQDAGKDANRIISQLENLYFKGGQTEGLASGRLGGVVSSIKGAAGKNEQLQTFKGILESVRPKLARAMGDSGNFSLPEQEAAVRSIPNEFATPEEAFAFFRATREKFGLGPSKRLSEIEKKFKGGAQIQQPTSTTTQSNIQSTQSPQPQQAGGLDFLKMARQASNIGGAGAVDLSGPISDVLFPRGKETIKKALAGQQVTGEDVLGSGAEAGLTAASLIPTPAAPAALATKIPALARLLGIGAGLGRTASSGAIYGATDPNAKSMEERGEKALGGGLTNLLTAGALRTPGVLTKALQGKPKENIMQVFKPTTGDLTEFRRNTGLDFPQEIIKRDLKNIAGKDTPEILEYYSNKVKEFNKASDKFLEKNGKPVDKTEIINLIDKQIEKLGGVKDMKTIYLPDGKPLQINAGTGNTNRVGQDPAIKELLRKKDEILAKPSKINLVDINQFKRDFQSLAGGAVGGGESSSVAANAYDDLQRELGKFIAGKAPGIKDINKSIQFYHLAKNSIQKQADAESKRSGSILSQALTTGVGATLGGVGQLAFGNPLLSALGILGGAGVAYGRAKRATSESKTSRALNAVEGQKNMIPDFLKRLIELQGAKIGSSI